MRLLCRRRVSFVAQHERDFQLSPKCVRDPLQHFHRGVEFGVLQADVQYLPRPILPGQGRGSAHPAPPGVTAWRFALVLIQIAVFGGCSFLYVPSLRLDTRATMITCSSSRMT